MGRSMPHEKEKDIEKPMLEYLASPAFAGRLATVFQTPDELHRLPRSSKLRETILSAHATALVSLHGKKAFIMLSAAKQSKVISSNPEGVKSLVMQFNFDDLWDFGHLYNQQMDEWINQRASELFQTATPEARLAIVKNPNHSVFVESFFESNPKILSQLFAGDALTDLAAISPRLAWRVIKANKDDLPGVLKSASVLAKLSVLNSRFKGRIEEKWGAVTFPKI